MNLLQMSFSGAILILAVIFIRAIAINKLPKRTFLALWGVVLLRLLIPFSIPSILSMYSLVSKNIPNIPVNTFTGITVNNRIPVMPQERLDIIYETKQISYGDALSVWFVIWLIGMILCAAFFMISYLRCRFEFQTSLPVYNEYVEQWLKGHLLKRPISVRQIDKVSSPLTYGIFHPVILMPKKTDWENIKQLQYVLLHEYMHIRRHDTIIKLITIFALCIHWFNPFVWIMYVLFNRDIELACDESVVRWFGDDSKSSYAQILINMEAKKSGVTPFCNNFSKNAIEERITAIMKIKRTSLFAMLIAVGLIVGVTTVFATSSVNSAGKVNTIPDTNFSDKEYEKLLSLQFDGYEDMSISEYQNKVWELTDTVEYQNLLERFSHDEMLYERKDNNEIASFLFYILTPLTSERWQSRSFGGYATSGFPYPSDNAALEYFFTLTILNPDTLTVQEYNTTRLNLINGLQSILQNKTAEKLQNEMAMQETVQADIDSLIKQLTTEKLQIMIDYVFSPLTNPPRLDDEKDEETDLQDEKGQEVRRYPNATEEDYQSLLALKTPDYQSISLADFNMALLEWANEDYDRMERINEDIGGDDFQVSLSSEELSFIKLTTCLSRMENVKYVQSNDTGKTEENPVYAQLLPQKREIKNNRSAWCDLYYQFSYHISDKKAITVGERDRCINGVINGIQEFWDKISLDDILKMTKRDIVKKLQEIASEYSNKKIEITTDEEQVFFECMDERNRN